MATKTLGTLATTTLTAVQIPPGYNATPMVSEADWATINNAILNDALNPRRKLAQNLYGGAFQRSGLLYVPNRGVLQCQPGDWVAVGPDGWPILIASKALAQTLTATGTVDGATAAMTALSTNVLNLGWASGMAITGLGVPAGTIIQAIANDGLSLTLSKNSTGANAAATYTVGSWTHS